jgi:hypothetical protein
MKNNDCQNNERLKNRLNAELKHLVHLMIEYCGTEDKLKTK